MNIVAGRHSKINNSVPHPVNDNEKLFIMPDCVRLYMGEQVFFLDQDDMLKLCPHLKTNECVG